ncbi:hypothetical protein GGR57DRAFT_459873 [Xylariaceae sp. FL1272]|nr:hypothetical protein GGR57DRAFT_459873 [Xylariaceae sp. FL1272]
MTPAAILALLRNVVRVSILVSIICTIHLYLWPIVRGCAFPLPPSAANGDDGAAFRETWHQHRSAPTGISAPFRLLALGDPQLEGDTSIANYGHSAFHHAEWAWRHLTYQTEQPSLRKRIRQVVHDLIDVFFDDIPDTLESIRKHVDLFGNDFYLAHIYRLLMWWTKPTHVTVLGDLLGSQWIEDAEFQKRSWRFWNRSFKGGERIPDDIAAYPADDYNVSGILGRNDSEAGLWTRRIINVVGNHDIGYAGDLTTERLERFERAFGKSAYELRFELPIDNPVSNATMFDPGMNPSSDRLLPEVRIVNLNNMNLDTPALEQKLQDDTYSFINAVIHTSTAVEFKGHFTIVLTHMPLYKPEGICVDAPFFAFHEDGGGVKEQNQLSYDASRGMLEGIYGLNGDKAAAAGGRGRPGIIINGHDHEGCDIYHYINQTREGEDRKWEVTRWENATKDHLPGQAMLPGMREITVRSMMADFGGNAGLLSLWFDEETWEWKYEFANCALGRQYYWWFVHVFDLVLVVLLVAYAGLQIAIASGFDAEKWIQEKVLSGPAQNANTKKSEKMSNGVAEKPKQVVRNVNVTIKEDKTNGDVKKI